MFIVGDEFPKCMSFTANATGGEYKHKLTIAELASHSHRQVVTADTGNGTATRTDYTGDHANAGSFPQDIGTHDTGGDQSHNNIQPYIVIYRFRRTA